MYFYYMLSHSIDWDLLDVVYNILNMQLYVTSSWGMTSNCIWWEGSSSGDQEFSGKWSFPKSL